MGARCRKTGSLIQMSIPAWQYLESAHPGADFDALSESYDLRMQKFRNVQGEIKEILDFLDLQPDQAVLEMGTGTGEFALAAARCCSKVYAVDLSLGMLRYAEKKAQARRVSNVEFLPGGFLTYSHQGEPLDVAVSQLALHHLPDFWKQIALIRLAGMLKPGGRLCLRDVVYSFSPADYARFFDEFLSGESDRTKGDCEFVGSITSHVKNEYSTMDWVMQGMIERAGFRTEKIKHSREFFSLYLCRKL